MRANYNDQLSIFTLIEETLNPEYAPLPLVLPLQHGMLDAALDQLNRWWRGRMVVRERIADAAASLVASHGFSLSDQYWIKAKEEDVTWAALNFFLNDFETPGYIEELDDVVNNPDATTSGNLRKRWIVRDEERLLVKSGSNGKNQEPYNEAVFSKVYATLAGADIPQPGYVDYWLESEQSVCANAISENEEFVPAQHVFQSRKLADNDYQGYLAELGYLGVLNPYRLELMFILDYIMGNQDRHRNNFGVVRNVETLKITRLMPVFDNGNSLWFNRIFDGNEDLAYRSLPFNPDPEQQIALVCKHLSSGNWYDATFFGDTCANAIAEILPQNRMLKLLQDTYGQLDVIIGQVIVNAQRIQNLLKQ
jgi:hypothetical protein